MATKPLNDPIRWADLLAVFVGSTGSAARAAVGSECNSHLGCRTVLSCSRGRLMSCDECVHNKYHAPGSILAVAEGNDDPYEYWYCAKGHLW